jgi:uridylate kinase
MHFGLLKYSVPSGFFQDARRRVTLGGVPEYVFFAGNLPARGFFTWRNRFSRIIFIADRKKPYGQFITEAEIMTASLRFNRVLLKLSGEALKGQREFGYDAAAIRAVVAKIRNVIERGAEVAIVVGAGNIWRGKMGGKDGMDRVNADKMGMLATVMNAMALREFFTEAGVPALIQCAIPMGSFVTAYDREQAIKALESGQVVIFAGGTGNPFFTTDTAATLRALETECDAVLKATKVDGVYSADPMKDPDAVRYSELSFDEALEKHLSVMDAAAFSLCRDNGLPVIVFDFSSPDTLERVISGDSSAGTVVS